MSSDNTESPNQIPQTLDPPPPTTMATETAQSPPPQPEIPTAQKHPNNVSFSIWPPTDRTRDAVRNRLIETLSSPSILSKRYGTVSRDEAAEFAKLIEAEAFQEAGKKAAATTDDDGIEILQVYSKEISKRMLDTVKARSGEPAAVKDEGVKAAEEEDAGSTAPPHSEKTESVVDDD